MIILGITSYFHDSSAALIVDGKVVIAIQEERLTRKKHDSSFPILAIKYCLKYSSHTIDNIDKVVYFEKPFVKFDRIIRSFIKTSPFNYFQFRKVVFDWANNKLFIEKTIRKKLREISPSVMYNGEILYSYHHLSHAAIGYYSSNFNKTAILVIDAVGEEATTSMYTGEGNKMALIKEYNYPNSIGLLYSSFTQFLGFRVNSDEYKLMGLTAYGDIDSEQTKLFKSLIYTNMIIQTDDFYKLNMDYFKFEYGKSMINSFLFEKLFNIKARIEGHAITQEHCNLALAIQSVVEELLLLLVKEIKEITNLTNLIISGGVAHNSVAMGKIKKAGIFNVLHVPFAPGDSGTSIGSALAYYYSIVENSSIIRQKISPYLGRKINSHEISRYLKDKNIEFEYYENFDLLIDKVASKLNKGFVIGWFQDKSEFGERALGNRSILMDPSTKNGKVILNSKIKFRERFRPFAPVICKDDATTYFKDNDSDFMQYVTKINNEYRIKLEDNISDINSKFILDTSSFGTISHYNYTSRLQTVSKEANVKLWKLLKKYKEYSGIPMLVNTSFNIKGEPIVENIKDAFNTFVNSGIDYLVLDSFVINKTDILNERNT